MAGFSLAMGMQPIILSGLLQGFGLGCTFAPLNTIALSDLPRHILTQGTALRSLMRNLGGSIGIPILEARLAENTQIVHSRLVEHLRLGNPLARAPYLAAPFNLTTAAGIAALNAEVTRQAAMVAYINDFRADDDRHDRPNRAVAVGALAAPLVRRLPAPSLRGLRGPAARGEFEPSNSGLPAVISKMVGLFDINAYYHQWVVVWRSGIGHGSRPQLWVPRSRRCSPVRATL